MARSRQSSANNTVAQVQAKNNNAAAANLKQAPQASPVAPKDNNKSRQASEKPSNKDLVSSYSASLALKKIELTELQLIEIFCFQNYIFNINTID